MRIGFLSLPIMGHQNPMATLARKVQARGHEVFFIGLPDERPIAEAAGLTFFLYGEKQFPIGSLNEVFGTVAKLQWEDVLQQHAGIIAPAMLESLPDDLVEKLRVTPLDGMIIDRGFPFIELAPIYLGIPFIHICNSLHMDTTGATPASIFDWPYADTPEALERNIQGLMRVGEYFAPILAAAQAFAKRVDLPIDWSTPRATDSPLAEITQTPREFDLPGIPWPPTFHYAGPFHDGGGRQSVSFPWEQLGERPLIYASLGTVVNGMEHIYDTILEAVEGIDSVQVVLSIGKNVKLEDLRAIPPHTIVVQRAPQIELLARAALCITHAGLNTTLECLAAGVPMVALPVAYDQPGVSTRIVYHGVGERITLDRLNSRDLKDTILKVLKEPTYRAKAQYFRKVIAETRGLDLAALIIERAFESATHSLDAA